MDTLYVFVGWLSQALHIILYGKDISCRYFLRFMPGHEITTRCRPTL